MNGIFGWSYPPGAADDPNAPYNQGEEESNDDFIEMFADYDSLSDLYHALYKYTECGPNLLVQVYGEWGEDNGEAGPGGVYPVTEARSFYGDDLRLLGTFKDMNENGLLITGLGVSSIVEGVDQCTEEYWTDWEPHITEPEDLKDCFWQAVKDCNDEANDIWMQTHGCSTCAKHWGTAIDSNEPQWGMVEIPVWIDCPDCEGSGIPI